MCPELTVRGVNAELVAVDRVGNGLDVGEGGPQALAILVAPNLVVTARLSLKTMKYKRMYVEEELEKSSKKN